MGQLASESLGETFSDDHIGLSETAVDCAKTQKSTSRPASSSSMATQETDESETGKMSQPTCETSTETEGSEDCKKDELAGKSCFKKFKFAAG